MATVTSPTLPQVPLAAAEFAALHGAANYVRPVLELARRLFPDAALTIRLEHDAETGEPFLLIEAEVAGFTAQDFSDREWQWASELFQVCPSTKTSLFTLLMVS